MKSNMSCANAQLYVLKCIFLNVCKVCIVRYWNVQQSKATLELNLGRLTAPPWDSTHQTNLFSHIMILIIRMMMGVMKRTITHQISRRSDKWPFKRWREAKMTYLEVANFGVAIIDVFLNLESNQCLSKFPSNQALRIGTMMEGNNVWHIGRICNQTSWCHQRDFRSLICLLICCLPPSWPIFLYVNICPLLLLQLLLP